MALKHQFVPSIFTSLNFFFGFLSIISSTLGNLDTAAWYIIFAVICDGMDGQLARWVHSETAFGFELDSLADLVSTGLAPALLIYQGSLIQIKYAGVLVCFVYLFSGGFRLARFNVLHISQRSKGFIGLPIPITGFTIAALWIFKLVTLSSGWWIAALIFLSLMMISTIRYDWPKLIFTKRLKDISQSLGVILGVLLMAFFPYWCLFPFLCLYIFLGVGYWGLNLVRGKTSLSKLFIMIQD